MAWPSPEFRLDPVRVDLVGQPGVEIGEQRPTPGLMRSEPIDRRQARRARLLVTAIHLAQRLENVPTFRGKAWRDLHDLPARVRETMPEHHREGLGEIARQRIAHLDRRPQIRGAFGQDAREILSGVPMAREEERDALAVAGRDEPGREDPGALRGGGVCGPGPVWRPRAGREREDGQTSSCRLTGSTP
jgi:hypothetical protein